MKYILKGKIREVFKEKQSVVAGKTLFIKVIDGKSYFFPTPGHSAPRQSLHLRQQREQRVRGYCQSY